MLRNFADEPFTGQLKLSLPPQSAKTIPLMTADQVNRIPTRLLDWTWSVASEVQDLDEITVVTVTDRNCHLQIQRVTQWFLHGENASFFIRSRLEVVRADENKNKQTATYDAKTHANNLAWRTTVKTHTCFKEEIELYKFSVTTGLTDLQAVLSRHLCSQYPVYVAETVALLKALYRNDTFTPFDTNLARFVTNRIDALQNIIAKDETLLRYLRTPLPPKQRLHALPLHTSNPDAIEAAAETLSVSVGKVGETEALLAAFVEKYLNITDPTPTAPTGPADRRTADHRTGEAMIIFDAIYRNSSLVISEQDGRGTMRSTRSGAILPNSRDDDFRVSRGELLFILPKEISEKSSSASLVCNRHGDVGELSRDPRLTPLQEVYSRGPTAESGRRAPMSPTSESDNKVGEKRRRMDSWRPSAC